MVRTVPAWLAAFVLALGFSACGGDDEEAGGESNSEQLARLKSEAASEPKPMGPLGKKQCESSAPKVCEVAGELFGDTAIYATAFGNPIAISYSFEAEVDEKAIEDTMVEAYEATFDAFPKFDYVDIAAFKPGDEPGVDFPIYNTSIGSNEVKQGADPATYWTVHAKP